MGGSFQAGGSGSLAGVRIVGWQFWGWRLRIFGGIDNIWVAVLRRAGEDI